MFCGRKTLKVLAFKGALKFPEINVALAIIGDQAGRGNAVGKSIYPGARK
jgi:hypothetical protein